MTRLGYWRMNNAWTSLTSGPTLTAQNGAVFSTTVPYTTQAAGTSQYSILFDTNRSLVATSPEFIDFSGADTISVQCWINLQALPGSGVVCGLVSQWDTSGFSDRDWRLWLQNTSGTQRIHAGWRDTSGDVNVRTWDWSPAVSTWYHITWALDGSLSFATENELWLTGVSQGNGASSSGGSADENIRYSERYGKLRIGALSTGGGPINRLAAIGSYVKTVRLWNIALTNAQINGGIAAFDNDVADHANLVAHYKFNNDILGTGPTLATLSGSSVFWPVVPYVV